MKYYPDQAKVTYQSKYVTIVTYNHVRIAGMPFEIRITHIITDDHITVATIDNIGTVRS